MGRRGPRIEPRRVIFIGTEGRSERAFVRFLRRCCDEAGPHVHLHVKSGSGGGSVAVIRDAARYLKGLDKEDIDAKLVLLDRDRIVQDEREGCDARAEASKSKLEIIFQDPNLEGVLLRLHEGRESRQIVASSVKTALRKIWPQYNKSGLTADRLRQRFSSADVQRAARHDEQLARLLEILGL